VVSNEASVTYQTQNGSSITDTGSVSFVVGQIAGADIDPPRIAISEAGRDVVFPHSARNVGNGADAFDVLGSSPSGWLVRVFQDVDEDRRLSSADTVLTGPLLIDFQGEEQVLVVVSIPTAAVQGTTETITTTMTSQFDLVTIDPVVDEIRLVDAGVDPMVTKSVDNTIAAPDDLLTYTMTVRVDGAGARDSVFLEDPIPAFATYVAGTLQLDGQSLSDAPDGDAGSYQPTTGTVRVDLSTIAPDTDVTVLLQARVDASAPIGSQVVNRARLRVHTPMGQLEEESAPVTTGIAAPELRITKSVRGLDPATVGDTLTYTIEVENPSASLAAANLLVVDTLPTPLTPLEASVGGVMNGPEVRWNVPRLEAGQTVTFEVTALVPTVTEPVSVVNRALLLRDGASGEFAESGSRSIRPDVEASLALDLESEVVEVGLGEALPLQTTVTNDGPATVTDLEVKLVLPEGTRFIEEAVLTGFFTSDRPTPVFVAGWGGPLLAPGDDFTEAPLALDSFEVIGDTLYVQVPGELRSLESIRFRYLLMVNSAPEGVLLNEAIAEARRGSLSASSTIAVASNEAQALVGLTRNRALETRTVIGKVFHDIDGDGAQDPDEPGVAYVDIMTADGELVSTDAFGKFSFNNLRPGRHAFRIDPISIPDGLTARQRMTTPRYPRSTRSQSQPSAQKRSGKRTRDRHSSTAPRFGSRHP
jgi:uncharacterized repeat protein (TIGR01451 family)